MATKIELRGFSSRLKSLLGLQQRFAHLLAEGDMKEKISVDKGSSLGCVPGQRDIARWKKLDSRKFGITRSMISPSSLLALKLLRNKGFEAYLVGGCVRDLILNRTPKDFDVITTANLKKIRRTFHHAIIIGRRFPICRVNLKGSVIEVSSFCTSDSHENDEAEAHLAKISKGCSKMDYVRWRDCTRRDFTINSLFYDPFTNEIYDYANAMMDLKSSKLQTLIPARLSFEEDCARILRGLRIAARLGLSFSRETEAAMCELSSSVTSLGKSRLMMELNYMLSYGAAEPSLNLLRRFNLLEILLPFQDAYLSNWSGDPTSPNSLMLMKLFSSLDKVVNCGQPCDYLLWIGLLAFHLALVTNPQEALVIRAFSSILYYGNWSEGIKAAREHALGNIDFEPEMLKSTNHLSDEELAQKVSKFSSIVQDSTFVLTDSDSLLNAMARFPSSRPGLALIPKKFTGQVAQLVHVSVHDTETDREKQQSYEINYLLLGKGDIPETRFVLGKVIMDTLSGGVVSDKSNVTVKKLSLSPSQAETDLELIKKQKLPEKEQSTVTNKRKVCQEPTSSSEKKPKTNMVLGKQASHRKALVKGRQNAGCLSDLFK